MKKVMKKISYSQIYIDDGLGDLAKERYARRRQHLVNLVDGLIVLVGLQNPPERDYEWQLNYFLYQDPLFLYLTGINQLKTALIIDPYNDETILFCSKKNPKLEFWEGKKFGYGSQKATQEIVDITGIKTIKSISQLSATIKSILQSNAFKKSNKTVSTLWYSNNKDNPIRDSNFRFKQKLVKLINESDVKNITLNNISDHQWELRSYLDEQDIVNVKEAQRRSSDAFKTLLKKMKNIHSESEAAGILVGESMKNNPFGLSFPPIVACGSNATILHYRKNNDFFEQNDLLLLDFGIRHHTMVSDTSRTVPVDGKFTALQSLLYNIVLTAQQKVEAATKPGVTIKTLNQICWDYINTELKKQITAAGGKFKLDYDYKPHGVSHLIGLLVHDGDPFRDYQDKPLQPGWLISNEPGLYGMFEIKINGEYEKRKIGIRIEDNLLITKSGCQNMTEGCPKTIKDLENWMANNNDKGTNIV